MKAEKNHIYLNIYKNYNNLLIKMQIIWYLTSKFFKEFNQVKLDLRQLQIILNYYQHNLL